MNLNDLFADENLTVLVLVYGPPALFAIAFLSATILPFSSEAAFVAALAVGISPGVALLSASAGNSLGCVFNYYTGRFLAASWLNKMQNSSMGKRAIGIIQNYGFWSVLISWVPLIGDPLTILGGVVRLKAGPFLFFVILFRVMRYLVLHFAGSLPPLST